MGKVTNENSMVPTKMCVLEMIPRRETDLGDIGFVGLDLYDILLLSFPECTAYRNNWFTTEV